RAATTSSWSGSVSASRAMSRATSAGSTLGLRNLTPAPSRPCRAASRRRGGGARRSSAPRGCRRAAAASRGCKAIQPSPRTAGSRCRWWPGRRRGSRRHLPVLQPGVVGVSHAHEPGVLERLGGGAAELVVGGLAGEALSLPAPLLGGNQVPGGEEVAAGARVLAGVAVGAVPDGVGHVVAAGAVREVRGAVVGRVAGAVPHLQAGGAGPEERVGDELVHELLLGHLVAVQPHSQVSAAVGGGGEDARVDAGRGAVSGGAGAGVR